VQVLDKEEEIANEEFEKLERRLGKRDDTKNRYVQNPLEELFKS
jgi:hypothetical protein